VSAYSSQWYDCQWYPLSSSDIFSEDKKARIHVRLSSGLQALSVLSYLGKIKTYERPRPIHPFTPPEELSYLAPYQWKMPRRIHIQTPMDLFDTRMSYQAFKKIWDVCGTTPHTYLVFLDNPAKALRFLRENHLPLLYNVWFGIELSSHRDMEKVEALRSIPTPVKFLSFKALTGSCYGIQFDTIDWALVHKPSDFPKENLWWYDELKELCTLCRTPYFMAQERVDEISFGAEETVLKSA
jgi:protein gp37